MVSALEIGCALTIGALLSEWCRLGHRSANEAPLSVCSQQSATLAVGGLCGRQIMDSDISYPGGQPVGRSMQRFLSW